MIPVPRALLNSPHRATHPLRRPRLGDIPGASEMAPGHSATRLWAMQREVSNSEEDFYPGLVMNALLQKPRNMVAGGWPWGLSSPLL